MAYSKKELEELIRKYPDSKYRWDWEDKLSDIESGYRDKDGFPLVSFI